jgi:hypothetical protein
VTFDRLLLLYLDMAASFVLVKESAALWFETFQMHSDHSNVFFFFIQFGRQLRSQIFRCILGESGRVGLAINYTQK